MFKSPFTALIAAAVLCAGVVPSAGAAPLDDSKPLKIGIIGTGNIGGALAKHWAKAWSRTRDRLTPSRGGSRTWRKPSARRCAPARRRGRGVRRCGADLDPLRGDPAAGS